MSEVRGPVVHYLNQFFAGLGGEEAAGHEPVRLDGPQGPGPRAGRRRPRARRHDRVRRRPLRRGRGGLARRAARLARRAATVRADLRTVVRLRSLRLRLRRARARGRTPRDPGRRRDDAGLARGHGGRGRRLRRADRARTWPACARSCRSMADLGAAARRRRARSAGPTRRATSPGVSARWCGPIARAPRGPSTCCSRSSPATSAPRSGPPAIASPPAPAVTDLSATVVALVTEAGCVPQGNPDRLPTRHANVWLAISARRASPRSSPAPTSPCTPASTPRRRTPTRTGWCRWTRRASWSARGAFARLHDAFYTTSGVDTPVATAAKFGQEIAARAAGGAGRRRDPHRHLRHRYALRGNACEGVRERGHRDRVRDRTADDRTDGGDEPHPAGSVDHPPHG